MGIFEYAVVKKQISWDSNLAYAIGLITTDGCLSIDGRHIDLTSKDLGQLQNFKVALKLNNKIGLKSSSYGKRKYYRIQIGDVHLYRFLLSIGLTPHKSKTLGPLRIPIKYFRDFLRGCLDGDGNISTWIHKTNLHRQWCLRFFSGSYTFASWLKDKTEELFAIKGGLYVCNKREYDPSYTIKFGKRASISLINQIYYTGCLALERKNIQTDLCLKDISKWSD